MEETLKQYIREALAKLGIEANNIPLEHPTELSHGDYATSVALAYAKAAGKNPRVLAEEVVAQINSTKPDWIKEITIAGPGFINFTFAPEFFTEQTKKIIQAGKKWGSNENLSGKKIMVEYTDPNPFKPFHIGHLMTNAIGESLACIIEFSGAKVVRANYQGDVGPHVAKAIWGLIQNPIPSSLQSVTEQAIYIGECYTKGATAYEDDPVTKKEIDRINKAVYERSDEGINKLYDWGRAVTLEAFEDLYKILGTKFDHYFFEREMGQIGIEVIKKNTPNVFEESDGAIVFKAEKYNPKLHTRVFVNSQGLPTYETKEVGLTETKFQKENPDTSIVITAVEQAEYMKVVEQAIAIMQPDIAARMKHITHGMMRLSTGKMSSRKGNVITGESLIRDSKEIIFQKIADRGFDEALRHAVAEVVGIGALKYSILRQAIGGDIIYDMDKSFSFEGDSGPYLQYSVTRAKAVLEKAKDAGIMPDFKNRISEISSLERILYRFPEVVSYALSELGPHHIATYLTELSSAFNSFYGAHQIIDTQDATSSYKVALTQAFATTLENGLSLLGIKIPSKM